MRVRRTLVAAAVAGATVLGAGAAAVAQQDSIGGGLLRSLGLDDDQVAEAGREADALLAELVEAGILDEGDLVALGEELADPDADVVGERFRTAAERWEDRRADLLDADQLVAWDQVREEFATCLETGAEPAECGVDVTDDFDDVWSGVDDFGSDELFGEFFDGDFFDGELLDEGFGERFGPGFDDGFDDGFAPELDDGFGPGLDGGFDDGFGPEILDPAGDPGMDDPYLGADAEEAA